MHLPTHFKVAIGSTDQWRLLLRSPGRINIIGEHTDYNGGWVLPAAIEQSIFFATRPSLDDQFHFKALDIDEHFSFSLPSKNGTATSSVQKTGQMWVDYLLGILQQFIDAGHELAPQEIIFGGNLPRGAGVSSSAALEGGMAFLCNELTKAGLSRVELAQLCKRSSNQFMGIPSGIMDQFASLNGQAGKAILLDCNTLEHHFIEAKIPDYSFVLVNSEVAHQLGNSEYPVRVAQCQEGLKVIQEKFPNVAALSQATLEMVEHCKPELSEVIYRRCRYVAGENARIKSAVAALKRKDAVQLGHQLNATHAGLRDDYEVSCPEVDFLQSFAQEFKGVAGSRIMGGGFGGCTINLILTSEVAIFWDAIASAYQARFGIQPSYFVSQIHTGTHLIE